MKRLISILLITITGLLLISGCGSNEPKDGEQVNTIIANYSIKNTDDSKDFIVEVQDLGGVYSELYDKDGLYVKFKGGSDQIFDKKGNELSRKSLQIGATLQISYDGKLIKNNPKTIKAYKVTVID